MSSILPSVLVSSVVRGANQGDSHGGLYRVDLERETFEQLVDWNDGTINFEGRGADRGLRGIAVWNELVFVAASDELFVYDRSFRIVASYRNKYLKHCHEVFEREGGLWLTSTGFDSLLRFDLVARRFDLGLQIVRDGDGFAARSFDPEARGPLPNLGLHLNNVFVDGTGIYTSGLKLPALLRITEGAVAVAAELPEGTHNARPYEGGILLNDTDSDRLVWFTSTRRVSIPAPRYPEEQLMRADADTTGIARQVFGRGLCVLGDRLVAAGSSPTTVSVCDLAAGRRVKSINLTMDVRNAAHGLAVWPF